MYLSDVLKIRCFIAIVSLVVSASLAGAQEDQKTDDEKPADPDTGDGAGILTQLPDAFFREVVKEEGIAQILVGLPIHTLVRGRFVMQDRKIVSDTKGWGRSVHRIQRMPPPAPKNSDQTLMAVTGEQGAGASSC